MSRLILHVPFCHLYTSTKGYISKYEQNHIFFSWRFTEQSCPSTSPAGNPSPTLWWAGTQIKFDIGANSLTAFLTDLPVRSSNMRTPRDQQSAPKSWPLFIMTSGATYSGVPQKVQVFFPRPIFLAKPKSAWKKRTVFQGGKTTTKHITITEIPLKCKIPHMPYQFNITLCIK